MTRDAFKKGDHQLGHYHSTKFFTTKLALSKKMKKYRGNRLYPPLAVVWIQSTGRSSERQMRGSRFGLARSVRADYVGAGP